MKVKTLPGEKCPMEGKHREYITDDPKGVEVPDTIYYRRLLAEGSLVGIEAEIEVKVKVETQSKSQPKSEGKGGESP